MNVKEFIQNGLQLRSEVSIEEVHEFASTLPVFEQREVETQLTVLIADNSILPKDGFIYSPHSFKRG